jgi:hypothetical protein
VTSGGSVIGTSQLVVATGTQFFFFDYTYLRCG